MYYDLTYNKRLNIALCLQEFAQTKGYISKFTLYPLSHSNMELLQHPGEICLTVTQEKDIHFKYTQEKDIHFKYT